MPMYLNRLPGARDQHEFINIYTDTDQTVACRVCMCTWKSKPHHGKCAGVRVYDSWDDVPKGLVSKTAMERDYKRTLAEGTLPAAVVRSKTNAFTPLYIVVSGKPKRTFPKG